jgi:hypothetical protein
VSNHQAPHRKSPAQRLMVGSVFGEGCVEALQEIAGRRGRGRHVRPHTVHAVDAVDLRFLTLDNLAEIAEMYPRKANS